MAKILGNHSPVFYIQGATLAELIELGGNAARTFLRCQPLIGAADFVNGYLLSPPICSANRPLRGWCSGINITKRR